MGPTTADVFPWQILYPPCIVGWDIYLSVTADLFIPLKVLGNVHNRTHF